MLFKMRYRTHNVQEDLIEADDEIQADKIAKVYLGRLTRSGKTNFATFISVYPAVVADKSILKASAPDVDEVVKARPTVKV